jgi:hypothetical protein
MDKGSFLRLVAQQRNVAVVECDGVDSVIDRTSDVFDGLVHTARLIAGYAKYIGKDPNELALTFKVSTRVYIIQAQ